MKRKGKEKQGNQLNLSRQLVMHQISCLLQLHNCISFFLDLGFKSAYKYWNYKLKEMVYVMHDLFLRIILTEKSWLKCRHFSVLFYWHFAGPFRGPAEIMVLLCTFVCILLLSVPGSSFGALLTVSCCSAKGSSTSLFHRPLPQNLQHLFPTALQDFKISTILAIKLAM